MRTPPGDEVRQVVRSYFERHGPEFDLSYDGELPLYRRVGDLLFRGILQDRLSLLVNASGCEGLSVLDVGAGSGRLLVEMMRRGAARGVAVDLSPAMVQRGREVADREGVGDRIEWVTADYVDWYSDQVFDLVMSTGCTEYLVDPRAYLARMIAQCRGTAWIGFAKRWEARVPFRVARMIAQRGYVRFFSRREIHALFAEIGDTRFLHVIDIGRDWLAVYAAEAARRNRLDPA